MALLAGGEHGIAEERFTPQFGAGGSIAQSEGAIVSITTIEAGEHGNAGVIHKKREPFRAQLIAIGDDTLIGLMHTAHEFTSEQAREAGRLGGEAAQQRRAEKRRNEPG